VCRGGRREGREKGKGKGKGGEGGREREDPILRYCTISATAIIGDICGEQQ
jgi:hypothetical protein